MTKRKKYDTLSTYEDGTIDFYGWDLEDSKIIEEIESYEGEKIKIVDKEEGYYYSTRFFDGSDAQECGFSYWFFFVQKTEKIKKNYGKCTHINYTIDESFPN